jgi:hypothetical protein
MKTNISQSPSGSKVNNFGQPMNAGSVVRSPVVAPKRFSHITLNTGHVSEQFFSEIPGLIKTLWMVNFDDVMLTPEGKVMIVRPEGEWPARFTLDGTNLLVELFRFDDKAMHDVPEVWFGVAVDASQGVALWQLLHQKAVEYGEPLAPGLGLKMPNNPWIAAALNQKIDLNSMGFDGFIQRFVLQSWVRKFETMTALGFAEWLISRQSK